jgi:hypothetical protein
MVDGSPEVSVNVDRSTIGIAPLSSSAEITSRTFDRPTGSADILNHKFRLMSEEAEDRAVAEITIFFFEHGKLMSDTPHSLRRRM